jgi:hypothetical protein
MGDRNLATTDTYQYQQCNVAEDTTMELCRTIQTFSNSHKESKSIIVNASLMERE